MRFERMDVLPRLVAIACIIALLPGEMRAYAPPQAAASASTAPQAAKIPPQQLDSLVAPIALYPDPLLAQVLAASTYPLEIVLLQRWVEKNKTLKDKELADAVAKEPWDASVKALAALPDVVKRLGDDVQWTTDLGNAFLAQQSDVMDAVQRMRKTAIDKGTLKSSEQQKVETKVVETKQVVVIEQANPQVVYVPTYNPTVVWGAPYYPYPAIYYPPYGYYAAGMAISFGVGVAMGAMWSGGWGYGCGWGHNDIDINVNNNFNRNNNINRGNNINSGNRPSQQPSRDGGRGGNTGNNKWSHSPEHRGGTPYRDRSTADRFGGTARGDSMASRRASAQQQIGRQGGNLASNRGTSSGLGGTSGLGGRSGSAGASNRASGSGLGGGADRIGSRDLSRSGGGNRDAFGGGTRGYSGSSARSSSSRGSSSVQSRGGGGGGFSGGGMSRGGGGGRRR